MIVEGLLMLKLGVYAVAKEAPLKFWFNVGTNIVSTEGRYPTGLEIAGTMEPEIRKDSFLGERTGPVTFHSALFLGVRQYVNRDLDVAIGIKKSQEMEPYISVSLKLGSFFKK